jgi:DNA polymerase elongation subunit (family B)
MLLSDLQTDSVMFTIPPATHPGKTRMQYVFEQGAIIGQAVTDSIPEELVFELEGVLFPSIYYKKKCYAAKSWSKSDAPDKKLKLKGISAVRNDRSRLNKRLSNTVLELILNDNNVTGVMEFLLAEVKKLKSGELPMTEYVISKNLKSLTPKSKSPHVEAVLRLPIAERPFLGSKTEYVIIAGRGELYEKSRVYTGQTDLVVDKTWYFDTQILNPMVDLLGPVIDIAVLRRRLQNCFRNQGTIMFAPIKRIKK